MGRKEYFQKTRTASVPAIAHPRVIVTATIILCHFVASMCATSSEFSVIIENTDYSILTVHK